MHVDTQIPTRLRRFSRVMLVLPGKRAAFPSVPLGVEGAEHRVLPRVTGTEGVWMHKRCLCTLGSAAPASPSIVPSCRREAGSGVRSVAAEDSCIPCSYAPSPSQEKFLPALSFPFFTPALRLNHRRRLLRGSHLRPVCEGAMSPRSAAWPEGARRRRSSPADVRRGLL